MAVPAGQRALLPVPDAWPLLEVHCVFAVVAVQGPEVVGRLIGSSVVPPSVCDLGTSQCPHPASVSSSVKQAPSSAYLIAFVGWKVMRGSAEWGPNGLGLACQHPQP